MKIRLDLTLSDSLANCTSGGKGLLYIDAQSMRYDEKIEEEKKIEFSPGVYGWLESTYDMYVYDIRTGEKSIAASIRSGAEYDALSPDGTKLLLGERHRKAEKKGGVKWDYVWFTGAQNHSGAKWFPDFSGRRIS